MKLLSALMPLLATCVAAKTAPSKAEIEAATAYFDQAGFLLLQNFFSEENKQVLNQWKVESEKVFDDIFHELHDKGYTAFPQHIQISEPGPEDYGNVLAAKKEYALKEGREEGFQEIVMRNPGRYEISLSHFDKRNTQVASESLLEQLETIVAPLLRQDNLDNVGMQMDLLIATAGAEEQKWHADGEHQNMEQHAPVHCFSVFVPLVDVPMERGPTEFFPASHFVTRQEEPMKFNSQANNTLNQPLAPTMRVGDALLFDYRLLHRGKANLDIVDRPMLVFIFHQPWFKDLRNWPKRSIYD